MYTHEIYISSRMHFNPIMQLRQCAKKAAPAFFSFFLLCYAVSFGFTAEVFSDTQKVKAHFSAIQTEIAPSQGITVSFPKIDLTAWNLIVFPSDFFNPSLSLFKAFFISAYERNLFYVFVCINAP